MAINKIDSKALDEAIFNNNEASVVIFSREGCHVCQDVV